MARLDKNLRIWRVGRLEQLFRRTGLFLWSLKGTATKEVITGFADHWRGSAIRGSQIMASGSSWRLSGDEFEDFGWLRDLRAFGGSQARSRARRLISNWLHQNEHWTMRVWQPDIMSKRLANLVFCYDWYGSSADESFQRQLTKTVRLQARCLAIDWKRLRDCDAQVEALCGLIIAEAALGATADDLDSLMEFVVQRVDGILFDDGGHKSRMPDNHMKLMRNLIEIRNTGFATASDLPG